MVEIQINTTQNVNINFTAASVGERILAYLIDLIIKIAYSIVTYQIVFNFFKIEELTSNMDYWSQISIYVAFYLPVIFYTLIFETLLDGQTPGKRILQIKVVKIDGYQASLADYIIRWFFRIVDLNIMSGLVALISIITTNKNQRLGDMTAGTSVISLKNNINISHTILEDLKDDYKPTYPSVIKLSDNDARIIKDTYTAAKHSKDYETLIKLREKIMEVAHIKERKENNDIDFISTVMKDYNYYTQGM
ncbi:RDD family protein [Urechidicola croceus]|uniref:RDD family protein n=1 Tax=Urechidicola croceus TaxID=1850246 RepID=A0A1D8P4B7_9FLAO|nr:RDD family protein [Urechidicola croceus]AOW19434.1 RDD family protein [Urechidicola croceus]